MTDLPAAAIAAAFAASPFANQDAVRHALEAAAPHITAAERERCAQLAEQHKATCKECRCATGDDTGTRHYVIETPFADLLREDTP